MTCAAFHPAAPEANYAHPVPRSLQRPQGRGVVLAAGAALALITIAAVVVGSPAMIHAPSKDRDFALFHYQPSYSIRSQTISERRHAGSDLVPNAVSGVVILAALILLFVMIFGLGWLVLAWWDRRPRRPETRARVAEPVPELLAGVNEAQRRLLGGRPANAIVACWMAVEESAARSGVPPLASDTSAEFTLRLLDSLDVDSEALQQLSLLYRRARFGSDPIGEADRELAARYLERIRSDLDTRVPAR